MSPGKQFDNNAQRLGDREKKEGSVWEQISASTSKALVIQAAASAIFTWETMKSHITMFFSQLSSLARRVPSAVSHLIINRGGPCHLAARHRTLLSAGAEVPAWARCHRARCQALGPRKPRMGSPAGHCLEGGRGHLLEKETRDSGRDDDNVWPSKRVVAKMTS